MPRPDYLYVYILLCSDGTYYVGVTNNPEKRLQQHNDGIDTQSYTYKRRPCGMLYHRRFKNFMEAIAREKQIKRWSHAKKKALIEGDFDELHRLAKCRNETHYRPGLGFARPDGGSAPDNGGEPFSSTPFGVDEPQDT